MVGSGAYACAYGHMETGLNKALMEPSFGVFLF